MGFYRSARAVAGASGDGAIDWTAVLEAAKAATDPGSVRLSADDKAQYAAQVRAAHENIAETSNITFEVPETVTVQNRHHWLNANVNTFRRVIAPLDEQPTHLAGVARIANTGSTAAALAFLANNVLGQYDPLLFTDQGDHQLYVVHPNVERVAGRLGVDVDRFRRWIVFHEATHAAEFGAAPWLTDYIETLVDGSITALRDGTLKSAAFTDLNTVMTVVEGYAELLMDHAFDREYADLRAALDAHRKGRGPVTRVLRRLFGIGLKRQQYERGVQFFQDVVDHRDLAFATKVWTDPEHLPSDQELESAPDWITRIETRSSTE